MARGAQSLMYGNTHPLLHNTKIIVGECEVMKALLHLSAPNSEEIGRILLQSLAHGVLWEHGIGG